MKRRILRAITVVALMFATLTGMVSLSGCDDDNGWWVDPPANTYIDRELYGNWELLMINGATIPLSDVNYLTFRGGGYGDYYYLDHGQAYVEEIFYWCNANYNRQTLTINYQNGGQATMDYWFSSGGDYLYMQWRTTSGLVQYVYQRVGSVPWGSPATGAAAAPALRPGV